MEKHFILMGDIEHSRSIDNEHLWSRLNKTIEKGNSIFHNQRLSKLDIKIGDEFQVIMNDMKSLLELMYFIDINLLYHGINCKFSIGYGRVFGEISKDSIFNLMGSGLTYSNEILSYKENKTKYKFFIEDSYEKELSLNTIGILLEQLESKITKKRLTFLYHKVVKQESDKELCLSLDTKERNIYRYKEDSMYNLHQKIFSHINLLFKIDENDDQFNKYLNDYNLPKLKSRNL